MGGSRRATGRRIRAALVTSILTVGIVVTGALPAAAATVVVNQNHEHGWQMHHTVCDPGPNQVAGENTGDMRFEPGPQGAPGAPGNQPDAPVDSDSPNGGPPGPSSGSLEFSVGENGWTVEMFRNVDYEGVLVDDIVNMDYWTYEDPEPNPSTEPLSYIPAVYIRLLVDKNGDGIKDDALVYEPVYQENDGQHEVDSGAWQRWIADDTDTTTPPPQPEGLWWLESLGDQAQHVANMKSLDEWTPLGSAWQIVNDADGRGGVILGAGCGEPGPWGDFVGNADRFTIEVRTSPTATESTTYDFEPGSPADATVLDCTPETDSNPTKTNHTVTCAATNSEGVPIPGTEVDVEATGANDPDRGDSTGPDAGDSKQTPDFSCVTDEEGECTFTHGPNGTPPIPTNEHGTTTYTAWIDIDEDDISVEADERESRVDTANSGGDDREPDGTDVVEKVWIERVAVQGGVDAEPEVSRNGLGESHTISATVYDQFGDPLPGNTTVKFEFFQGSPSDTDGSTPQTPDKTCATAGQSSCSITYTQTATEGLDLICVFINTDPAVSGTYPSVTCDGDARDDQDDQEGAADAPFPTNDDQDVVAKTWVAPEPTRLDCEPEGAQGPTGSAHRVTCTARSSTDLLVPFANIDAEATGANDPDSSDSRNTPDFTCTTNSSGSCSFVHGPTGRGSSSGPGRTTYRAWIDSSRNDGPSEADATEGPTETSEPGATAETDGTDVVEMTWNTSPLECEPEVSSGPAGAPHFIECSAAAGTILDAEISGANDPDDSDSPLTPDVTCVVGVSGRCVLTSSSGGPGSSTTDVGTSSYRVWIDADGSDSTNESDSAEGRDEKVTPGTTPESDNTDVVERTWTGDPVTQCNDSLDNDGDGLIDNPDDPGCESTTDTDESNPLPEPEPDPEPEPEPGPTCPGYESDPRNQVVGTSSNDRLVGTDGNDVICGLGGHDTIIGGGGNDLILGGSGNDTSTGQAGVDVLKGSLGRDLLLGGGGPDRISGGAGRDEINGGSGRDRCTGGSGRDSIRRCE